MLGFSCDLPEKIQKTHPDIRCLILIVKAIIWKVFRAQPIFLNFSQIALIFFWFVKKAKITPRLPLLNSYCKKYQFGRFYGPSVFIWFLAGLLRFSCDLKEKTPKSHPDFRCQILLEKKTIWKVFRTQAKIVDFCISFASAYCTHRMHKAHTAHTHTVRKPLRLPRECPPNCDFSYKLWYFGGIFPKNGLPLGVLTWRL